MVFLSLSPASSGAGGESTHDPRRGFGYLAHAFALLRVIGMSTN